MAWKDLSYVKKGGIIGLIIVIILYIFLGIISYFSLCSGEECMSFVLLYIIVALPIIFITNILGIKSEVIHYILVGCFYVLIGVLIGWIIGKIKSRKK